MSFSNCSYQGWGTLSYVLLPKRWVRGIQRVPPAGCFHVWALLVILFLLVLPPLVCSVSLCLQATCCCLTNACLAFGVSSTCLSCVVIFGGAHSSLDSGITSKKCGPCPHCAHAVRQHPVGPNEPKCSTQCGGARIP